MVHTTAQTFRHISSKLSGNVIWRPDLAAHVQLLDFREWGHCPRLENEYGRPWDDQVMSNDHFT